MEISLKGKTRQTVSIQMDDLLPSIIKAVKEDLGLSDDEELHYTSTTKFLTFNVIRDDTHRDRCNCDECTLWRLQQCR